MGNKTSDWRLNDLILNQTDESIHIFAHSTNNSKFNLTLPLQNKNCSARMLNLLLLIWSILSTVLWLILLAYKIYRFLVKDYGPSSSIDEIDERFAHESENSAHLYMPWLDPHNEQNDQWRKPVY
ncbi:hypothetical protein M3Y97_00814800 [Aphelenchoides bicaudatus]|nr:hypothetical protein M3Y97_00814800 [Aphelenchoides bicaudatus]